MSRSIRLSCKDCVKKEKNRFAKNIAKHIVRAREKKPIETTGELCEIIKAAIPAKMRAGTGHPAKQTFQALRIELNHTVN